MKALLPNAKPPVTYKAADEVDVALVELLIQETPDCKVDPPIIALPPNAKPPVTTIAAEVVDVAFNADVTATPEAVNPIPLIFPNTVKILLVES